MLSYVLFLFAYLTLRDVSHLTDVSFVSMLFFAILSAGFQVCM